MKRKWLLFSGDLFNYHANLLERERNHDAEKMLSMKKEPNSDTFPKPFIGKEKNDLKTEIKEEFPPSTTELLKEQGWPTCFDV